MSKSAQLWSRLSPGDIVDVIAPAGASKSSELKRGIKYLKSLGLKPRVPKDILRPQELNLSNTDAKRFQHLKAALTAKDSKIIWCLRGGYGSIRLIPSLKKLKKPNRSKVVLGFSDITTLHMFLNQNWNWSSLHSPTLTRMGQTARPIEKRELKGLLFGTKHEQEFLGLKPLNKSAKRPRKISGSVVGGNLTMVAATLGTAEQLKTSGKIIFLEDVNEKPYRVDRILEQMHQAGMFDHAKAVVFGTFTFDSAADAKVLWGKVMPRFVNSVSIPVLSGLLVGHGKRQHTLPFNTKASLSLGSAPSLIVDAGSK